MVTLAIWGELTPWAILTKCSVWADTVDAGCNISWLSVKGCGCGERGNFCPLKLTWVIATLDTRCERGIQTCIVANSAKQTDVDREETSQSTSFGSIFGGQSGSSHYQTASNQAVTPLPGQFFFALLATIPVWISHSLLSDSVAYQLTNLYIAIRSITQLPPQLCDSSTIIVTFLVIVVIPYQHQGLKVKVIRPCRSPVRNAS